MKKIILPLFAFNILLAAPSSVESNEAAPLMKDALTRIHASAAAPTPRDTALLKGQLHVMIQNRKFAADKDAAENIRIATQAAQLLVTNIKNIDRENDKALFDETNKAVQDFVDEISANIDENWKFPPVYANIAPPAGTPNAISGMNPDAIADPEQRKQYLALIEENRQVGHKNAQQRELKLALERIATSIAATAGAEKAPWTKEDALARFGSRKASKEALEEALQ